MRDTGYRILADGVTASNDTWATGLANHDLIIGPTGGGKTRGYVLPNLLSSQESFIVTDGKGTLRRQVGGILERRGFRVLELDFTDLLHSPWGYNPLQFIRYDEQRKSWNEQDIITVAAALVPVEDRTQPFWEYAARNLLEALIGYTLECLPAEEHTLASVARLFSEAETGVLDEFMRERCTIAPESFAAMRWKGIQTCRRADKTYGSVLGILSQKISNFSFEGARELFTNPNQIDFAAISHTPTAVFVRVSDSDFSLANLTSLFYTQALQALIAEADSRPDNRLQIPVRLYLDDFAKFEHPGYRQDYLGHPQPGDKCQHRHPEHHPTGGTVRPCQGYDHHRQLRPPAIPGRAERGDGPVYRVEGQQAGICRPRYAFGQGVVI